MAPLELSVHLDTNALEFVSSKVEGPISIIAHPPRLQAAEEYGASLTSTIEARELPADHQPLFLDVVIDTANKFEAGLPVHGVIRHGYRVLEAHGPAAPNTIAAVLLHIRDVTGLLPHLYFTRSGDNRLVSLLPFRTRSEGKVARITRELLAAAEHDASKRPGVHDD
ncbi:hypothetical protein [Pseudarthrobacter sp. Y6]|uniref:hypothetical protein n=1 Tax=Pseudarthrobacter sp. Y6 TaxID=3418422 RepID=UPI003CF7283E